MSFYDYMMTSRWMRILLMIEGIISLLFILYVACTGDIINGITVYGILVIGSWAMFGGMLHDHYVCKIILEEKKRLAREMFGEDGEKFVKLIERGCK